eukprot:344517-Chlamydomonas_euryale.AAC.4
MQQRGQTPCRRQQQHGECAVRRGGSLLQGRRERVVAHAIDAPSASPAEATASVVSAAASTSGIPPMVFEPQVDPVAAAAQLSVLAASVGLAAYWYAWQAKPWHAKPWRGMACIAKPWHIVA